MSKHIPTIYDVAIDQYRAVTQSDIDELVRIRVAYSHLRLAMYRASFVVRRSVIGNETMRSAT